MLKGTKTLKTKLLENIENPHCFFFSRKKSARKSHLISTSLESLKALKQRTWRLVLGNRTTRRTTKRVFFLITISQAFQCSWTKPRVLKL